VKPPFHDYTPSAKEESVSIAASDVQYGMLFPLIRDAYERQLGMVRSAGG
jgi:hypothetical protein